jgi:hypothetical protein
MTAEILNWAGLIPDAEWRVYRDGVKSLEDKRIPFAVGGGLAFSAFARRWRNTKDMDIYVLPRDQGAVIAALLSAGFEDYASQSPYDRSWSFRAYRGGSILDALWGMPSHLFWVEPEWLTRGPTLQVQGMRLRLLPLEELLRVKLYVLQRERCDWPDLLNILFVQGPAMDWRRVVAEMGESRGLLGSLLALFGWMCPDRAQELPEWLWREFGIERPPNAPEGGDLQRVAHLDARDWFGPRPPAAPANGSVQVADCEARGVSLCESEE